MRGKVPRSLFCAVGNRITPAHAGKRFLRLGCSLQTRDHPRTCGEKWCGGGLCDGHPGSPPHMRGKVLVYTLCIDLLRITPAHAGKRKGTQDGAIRLRDHPRTCGEKAASAVPLSPMAGSPPHMRGKVQSVLQSMERVGITPAHAGKSKSKALSMMDTWDHPRTCGEKTPYLPRHKAK